MKTKGLFNIISEEIYQDGQIVFKEGGSGDGLYTVLKGSIEISRNIKDRKYTIERLRPGAVFGELELIGGTARILTAQAVGETTIGIIDRESIKQEYEGLSKQFKSILETIPLRLGKVIDRACDIAG